ncbi:MAG: hypothetical protein FWH49_08420 [Clostridiales bacterium]|nr:hypothetical protein [Clostridiales bacterium]
MTWDTWRLTPAGTHLAMAAGLRIHRGAQDALLALTAPSAPSAASIEPADEAEGQITQAEQNAQAEQFAQAEERAPGTLLASRGGALPVETQVSVPEAAGESPEGAVALLLPWEEVKVLFERYVPVQVIDVRTGETYQIQSFSNGKHADVEPLTKADTDILYRTFNSKWAWETRPVWVILGDLTIAASINGMPHGGGTIADNGMNGQICLHFLGSQTHNGNTRFEKRHQDDVLAAWYAGLPPDA